MKKFFTKKTNIFIISMIVSVIIVFCCQFRVYQENQKLKKAFVLKQPDNVYARHEELTKEALLEVTPFERSITTTGLWSRKLTLQTTLCYYEKPGDWIPKKIYPRGTTIMLDLMGYGEPKKYTEIEYFGKYYGIYGCGFYPSYKKGWRVAIPFLTDTEYNKGIEPEYELAYIRTRAVKKLQKTTIKEEIVKTEWYLVQDKRLYEEGYYLSPDLYRSYFPAPVEAVILGWIGVIGWNLVRRCFKGRQKEKKGSSDYVLH